MGSFGGINEGSLGDGEPSSPTLFATSQGRVFAGTCVGGCACKRTGGRATVSASRIPRTPPSTQPSPCRHCAGMPTTLTRRSDRQPRA